MTKPQHHPRCECDFCFTDDLEATVEAHREIRLNASPLSTLPGWDHAEQLAREIAALNDELQRVE